MRDVLFASKHNNFILVYKEGMGIKNTHWKGLEIETSDLAKNNVIEVVLDREPLELNGTPVIFKYSDVHISRGIKFLCSKNDSLQDTEEYIKVLNEALDFAKEVKKFIEINPECYSR